MNPSWHLLLISILPLIAAGVSLLVTITAWRRRNIPGSIHLSGLMLAITIWCLLDAMEKFTISVTGKILWSQIQYTGIASAPVLYLVFSARYSRQDRWLTPTIHRLLWVVPLATILMVATNTLHMLHWSGFTYNPATNLLTYHYGPWFWVNAAVAYVYLLAASILLWRASHKFRDKQRWQFILVVLAALFPWLANAVHLLDLIPVQGLDPTPLAFAISGFLLAISITEYHLIDLTPIARTKLVDILQDAIIVIDQQGVVVDMNPAASKITGIPLKVALQKPAAEVLSVWPYLANRFRARQVDTTELRIIPDNNQRWYDTRVSTLEDEKNFSTGSLIVLRDITEQRTTQEELSRLAAVIEQANESILITNLDGDIVYVNSHFSKMTGYSIAEALGQKTNLLKSGHHSPSFYKNLWETIQSGKTWTGTFVNKRKDGSEYYEAGTIFPIKRRGGKITNYASVTRDISAEVIAEKALNRFTRQLTALHEISIELGQLEHIDSLTHQIVWLGFDRLGLERLCLRLLDPSDSNFLIGTYRINEHSEIQDERALRQSVSKDPIFNRLVYNESRVLNLHNEPLRDWNADILGAGDLAVAGIWEKERLTGYISTDNLLSGERITEQHTTILVLFCQTISNLFSRIREEQALQIFSTKLATLHDVSIELSQAISFPAMWKLAVDLGHYRLGFDRIQMWLIDSSDRGVINGSYHIDHHGYIRDERHLSIQADSHFYRDLLFSGAIRVVHQQKIELYDLRSESLGVGDLVAAGLWDGQNLIGYLVIDNASTGEPFNSYHLDLIALFAQTIGSTSTRIKVTQDIKQKAIQQEFLNEITRTAIEQTDYLQMIQTLVIRLAELFQSDGSFITLWDETHQIVQPGAASGESQDMYEAEIDPTINHKRSSISEVIISNGRVIAIDNVDRFDLTKNRLAQMPRVQSLLGLPLIANQSKLGVAIITYSQHHLFSQEEIALGSQAAQQTALAILKTRLLEEAEDRATEAETLRQASAAVAATLEREVAIERILEELNRVVPYDSASVQLLVGNELEIVGERGFKVTDSVIGLRFPITVNTPNSVVVAQGEPFIIDDAPETYESFRDPPHDHIHGWMGVPLKVHDKIIGMLALDSIQPCRFSQDHSRVAAAFADQVAIALENTRLFEETQWLAIHDSLTGIYNRRHFMSLAWAEFQRSIRYETPLSAIMLDIDHFKNVNDTYGHLTGDQVLQFIARLCEKNLRINDLISRYGGEEFLILLPETRATTSSAKDLARPTEIEPAKIVAERLRMAVEGATITTDRGDIKLTISLGIAELSAETRNIEQLIDHADLALLDAKGQGRNRVVIWNSEHM